VRLFLCFCVMHGLFLFYLFQPSTEGHVPISTITSSIPATISTQPLDVTILSTQSRPVSPLSRQSSSGYGSTRSKPEANTKPASSLNIPSLPNTNQSTLPRVQGRQTIREQEQASKTLPRAQTRQPNNTLPPLEIKSLQNSPTKYRPVPLPPLQQIVKPQSINFNNNNNTQYNVNATVLANKRKPPPPPVKPKPIKLIPLPTKKIPDKNQVTGSNTHQATPNKIDARSFKKPITSTVTSHIASTASNVSTTNSLHNIEASTKLTQFYSLRKPKEKITITQFYSLRRSDVKQPNMSTCEMTKSTPNISKSHETLKAPIPTPRTLIKSTLNLSTTSSIPTTPLKPKPIYQNVPIRISPNGMQQEGAQNDAEVRTRNRTNGSPSQTIISLYPPVTSWTLFL
jgi:hypothetical protein